MKTFQHKLVPSSMNLPDAVDGIQPILAYFLDRIAEILPTAEGLSKEEAFTIQWIPSVLKPKENLRTVAFITSGYIGDNVIIHVAENGNIHVYAELMDDGGAYVFDQSFTNVEHFVPAMDKFVQETWG